MPEVQPRVERQGEVIVVGQAPSKTSDPRRPLSGRSGRRLCALLGVTSLRAFRCVNLIQRYPGAASGKGDKFNPTRARRAAHRLIAENQGEVFLLLGRGVAQAFNLRMPFFEWRDVHGVKVGVIPHPSGVNFMYNDPTVRDQVAPFVRKVAAC